MTNNMLVLNIPTPLLKAFLYTTLSFLSTLECSLYYLENGFLSGKAVATEWVFGAASSCCQSQVSR